MAIGNSLYTTNDQLDASGYYDKIKPQYDELVQKKLDEINKASGVDIEENKKKVEEIKKIKHALASYKTVKTVCIVFLVLSSLGSIAAFISAALAFTPILYAVAVPLLGLAIFLICVLASKKRKSSRDDNQNRLNQLLDECTKQMAKLVNSIDSFIFPNIIEKVYSPFDFERMMKINNEWESRIEFSPSRSCITYMSGTLNKSPFLCRKMKNVDIIMKVYFGTSSYTDSRGRFQTRTATYTHPAPVYSFVNRFEFLNDSAKELKYSNDKKVYNFKNKQLPMENKDFDRNFYCYRNDESKFRLLFTLLAQENIAKLTKNLKYKVIKYDTRTQVSCDNFNSKIWISKWDFSSYDYEQFEKQFIDYSKEIFNNIYALASPIICIPIYQKFGFKNLSKKTIDLPSIPHVTMVLYNFFHFKNLVHVSTTTEYILGAEISIKKTYGIYDVTSNSFLGVNRVAYVNGVAVHYVDYRPLKKNVKLIAIKCKKEINQRVITSTEFDKIEQVIHGAIEAKVYADFLYILVPKTPTNFNATKINKILKVIS